MVIKGTVPECDFSGRKYDPPVFGGHCVAGSGSGKFSVVMWIGPEEIKKQKIEVLDFEETERYREEIASIYGWDAVDF
jgi:hypothetical protein